MSDSPRAENGSLVAEHASDDDVSVDKPLLENGAGANMNGNSSDHAANGKLVAGETNTAGKTPVNHDDIDVTEILEGVPLVENSGDTGLLEQADGEEEEEGKTGKFPCCGRRKKKKEKKHMVSFRSLFRYADCCDGAVLLAGVLAAVALGLAVPLNFFVFGDVLDGFIAARNTQLASLAGAGARENVTAELGKMGLSPAVLRSLPRDELELRLHNNSARLAAQGVNVSDIIHLLTTPPSGLDQVESSIRYFFVLGGVALVCSYFQMSLFIFSSDRQTRRMRSAVFTHIMRQDMAWHDAQLTGKLASMFSDEVDQIREGLGEKLGAVVRAVAGGVAGLTVGFIQGWQLALVILSVLPLVMGSAFLCFRMVRKLASKEVTAYQNAGNVAEQALSNIRTVAAFGGEEKEAKRYKSHLLSAEKVSVLKNTMSGVANGVFNLASFSCLGLCIWYGSRLIVDGDLTGGRLMQVLLGVLIGCMMIGQVGQNLQFVMQARAAAHSVWGLLDNESGIDNLSEEGEKPGQFQGDIEFKDVHFAYPSRPDVQVLQGLNLRVKEGETVALVGSSGCGKSTVVQLVQHLYSVSAGQVLIDGRDVTCLNPGWLRSHISVVSQEPVLFAATIAENIRFARPEATQEEIEEVCRIANAHDFISQLPEGYDTLVGEHGTQLSGGQKQRLAIARAVVRRPRILLLDEATSALDTEAEALVQHALAKASQGRTTIAVAHRLSTVQNADRIVAIRDGRVVEQGTHEELMASGGLYATLAHIQTHTEEDDSEGMTTEDEEEPSSPRDHQQHVTLLPSNPLSDVTGSVLSLVDMTAPVGTVDEAGVDVRAGVCRMLKLNAPELPYIVPGVVCAAAVGCSFPLFAYFLAAFLGGLADITGEAQKAEAQRTCLIMLGLGLGCCCTHILQNYLLGVSGERLTTRLRHLSFMKMLRQDIGWHDKPDNSVPSLCTRLFTEAAAVKGVTGAQIGLIIQSVSSICVALAIGLSTSWKLALVCFTFFPLIVLTGMIQGAMLHSRSKNSKVSLQHIMQTMMGATGSMRTVASSTLEKTFIANIDRQLKMFYVKSRRNGFIHSLTYAVAQSAMFFCYGAAYYYGKQLVADGELKYGDVFIVFAPINFAAQSVGRAVSMTPDLSKARVAARNFLSLLATQPAFSSSAGRKPAECRGNLKLSALKFSYPSRPGVRVLSGLTIDLNHGQCLALVGGSGCGKSTVMQLLLRFYDPSSGYVEVDGERVTGLNVAWLRQQIGLVSQEPVLFQGSLRDNIAYGDNTRDVEMEDVIAAAKMANIHDFIVSLPQGYETDVGERGTQLSGGQKQRVAIARALLRRPTLLLLDEATSALDSQGEKVVQEALERAQQGRTSVVIAHRLSTVRNADVIAVVHAGRITEMGTHAELAAKKGRYFRLLKAAEK